MNQLVENELTKTGSHEGSEDLMLSSVEVAELVGIGEGAVLQWHKKYFITAAVDYSDGSFKMPKSEALKVIELKNAHGKLAWIYKIGWLKKAEEG